MSSAKAPPSDFTVSTTINFQWVVNGQIQPTLTLTRGRMYTIDLISVSDEHPFLINNLSNSPFGTVFLPSSYGSVVTFTPTDQMPVHLWYHCNVHSGMTGAINLIHACPGDLNNDAIVNSTDFGLFVAAFGGGCSGCKADVNNDGAVNSTDFGLFVGAFGSSCD